MPTVVLVGTLDTKGREYARLAPQDNVLGQRPVLVPQHADRADHREAADLLGSLRQAGWRITVTSDMVRAKQLLQKREVAALILEINPAEHDADRLKILRFVQEFCRGTLVILLHAGADAVASTAQHQFVQSLNNVSDVRTEIQERAKFDLYQLSPAQKRIAEFVAQAYPNKEIARSLKIF